MQKHKAYIEVKCKETYTNKIILNHQQEFNMNIAIHRQLHGIKKHNRDTYLDD